MASVDTQPKFLFPQFADTIETLGEGAVRTLATRMGGSGRQEVFYTPFEYVERSAKVAIIGITPGTTQLGLSYAKAQEMSRAKRPVVETLKAAKEHAAFGGGMRTKLIKLLKAFDFAALMGAPDEASFWGSASHLLHSTSVIPHAAFEKGKMFAGSFDEVLHSSLLRQCFEDHFVPELALLPEQTVFVALGETPLAALDHCVAQGLIAADRVLGALAHPSPTGGSQVDVYLGLKDPKDLNPRDPVRHRVPTLLANAERMRKAVERLGGRPIVRPTTAPQVVPRPRIQPPAPIARAPVPARVEPPIRVRPQPPVATPGSNGALHALVSRGKATGTVLRPHVHLDGCYVVSLTRMEADYIRVPSDHSLEDYLRKGLRLRMSAPGLPPSLIKPESIRGRGVSLLASSGPKS